MTSFPFCRAVKRVNRSPSPDVFQPKHARFSPSSEFTPPHLSEKKTRPRRGKRQHSINQSEGAPQWQANRDLDNALPMTAKSETSGHDLFEGRDQALSVGETGCAEDSPFSGFSVESQGNKRSIPDGASQPRSRTKQSSSLGRIPAANNLFDRFMSSATNERLVKTEIGSEGTCTRD